MEYEIKDYSITTNKLADGSVTTGKIANLAITGNKISSGTITGINIADGAIGEAKLEDGSITEIKILDGSITLSKLSSLMCLNGEILKKTLTGWECSVDVGTGSVTAGGGLSNSGTPSDPILDVNVDNLTIEVSGDALQVRAGGITSLEIANQTITNEDIAILANIEWSKINKTGSSIADLTTRAFSDLTGRLAQYVEIQDLGGYFLANDAEGAIQEIGGNFFRLDGNSFGTTATIGTNDNNPFRIETNGLDRITVLANGNVGIGTTNPGVEFEIIGRMIIRNGTSLNIYNPDVGGPVGQMVSNSYHTLLNGVVAGTDGGTGQIVIGGTVNANTGGSNFNIVMGYGSSTTGAINGAIGRQATVTGDWSFALGYGATVNTGDNSFALGRNAVSTGVSSFALGYGATSGANQFVIGSSNYTQTILSGGNVGIGTTNPTSKLVVSDGSRPFIVDTNNVMPNWAGLSLGSGTLTTSNFNFAGDGTNLQLNRGSGGYIDFKHVNSTQVRILSNGNVGIATLTPTANLHVIGTTIISSTASVGGDIFLTNSGPRILNTSSGNLRIIGSSSGNGAITLNEAGTGNVGIGDTNPLSRLSVAGSIVASGATLTSFRVISTDNSSYSTLGAVTGGNQINMNVYGSSAAGNYISGIPNANLSTLYSSTTGGLLLNQAAASPIYFGTQNLERMRIDANGNVGIGTTTPASPLHIVSTSSQFRIGYDDTRYAIFSVGAGSGGDLTIDATGDDIIINDRVNIIANPLTILTSYIDIRDNVAGATLLRSQVTGETGFRYVMDHSGFMFWGSGTGPRDVRLFRSATNTLTIDDTSGGNGNLNILGNVGIGTTSPSHKLHVLTTINGSSVEQGGQLVQSILSGTNSYDSIGRGFQGLTVYANAALGLTNQATNFNGIFVLPNLQNGVSNIFTNVTGIQSYTGYANVTNNATVTNSRGLWIRNWGNSLPTGGFTNQYGVYIDAISGATNNYAIYAAGGQSYFAGNVGVGDTSPLSLFTVGNGDLFQVNSSGAIVAATGITSSGTITFSGLTNCSSGIQTDAGGVLSCLPSDQSLKNNVQKIDSALNIVSGLRGVTFNWRDNLYGTQREYGFIAQEVEQIAPELVFTMGTGLKGVKYSQITGLLVEAVKEQQSRIEDLDSRFIIGDLPETILTQQNITSFLASSMIPDLKVNNLNVSAELRTQTLKVLASSEFFGEVFFRNNINVAGDLKVDGQILGNVNTAGRVVLKAGATKIKVEFSKAYTKIPSVNITPVGSQLTQNSVNFYIDNQTLTSFEIVLTNQLPQDQIFNWISIGTDSQATINPISYTQ